MSKTLTIPDVDDAVELKLRMLADSHGRTVQAEAREILAEAVKSGESEKDRSDAVRQAASASNICDSVRGIWRGRGTTDEMMRELRGED